MNLQKIIYDALKELQATDLSWLKHLSTDFQIPIAEYPAVIIDAETFEFNSLGQKGTPATSSDECTLFLLKEYDNKENLIEGSRLDLIQNIREDILQIINLLCDNQPNMNGVSGMSFGKTDIYDTLINSEPVMAGALTIKGTIVN
jgi:hypothetical protein